MNAVFNINRFNENGPIPMRSERFYQSNGEWFFIVRQKDDQGPFKTFEDARLALTSYIHQTLSLNI